MSDLPPPNPNPPTPAPAPFIPSAPSVVPTGVPTGALPPPKKETGKVQPKKETVRINLPPKPTAAPTIKLPTLPPGGPTGAPSAAPVGIAPPSAAAPALKTSGASAAAPAKPGAPPMANKPGAPGMQKPAPVATRTATSGAPSIKGFDKVLIFTAAIASLAGVGGVVWVFLTLKNALETFQS